MKKFSSLQHLQIIPFNRKFSLCSTILSKAKKKTNVAPQETGTNFDLEKFKERFQSTIERFRKEMAAIRLGQANTGLLDSIMVELESKKKTKLTEISQIIVKDPQTINVLFADKAYLLAGERAILKSPLNLNPQKLMDQLLLRVPIPKLTQETREQLVKQVSQLSEEYKNKIRQHRQDARNNKKKDDSLTIDESKRLEKQIQDLTDQYIKTIDELKDRKQKEIQK